MTLHMKGAGEIGGTLTPRAARLQEGMNIFYLEHRFPNEASVIAYLFECQSEKLSRCDECGAKLKLYPVRGTKRYSGLCCKYIYRTVTKGTIFFKSTIPLRSWLIVIMYIANSKAGVTTAFIGAMLGIGKDTSFKMADQIRNRMTLLEGQRTVGGEGQHVAISFRRIKRTRNRGAPRGSQTLVMALFDSFQVVTVIVPNRRIQTITPIVLSKVQPGSVLLYVDGIEKRRLLGHGFHKRLSRAFKLESGKFHPAPINLAISYWTNFQRVFRATHGKARPDNIYKYLGECNFRFNRRDRPGKAFWDIIYSPAG